MILYNYLQDFYNFSVGNQVEDESSDTFNADEVNNEPSSFEDGFLTINKDGKFIYCITIIGQVEGHYLNAPNTKSTKYEHIIPRIVAVEEDKNISGLLVILNTIGGDVEAGLAIAELIAGMRKKTASLVLGGSHSIGIPLAVSTDRSFIVPTASMTVHPVRMNGLILGVPQALLYLKKMEDRVVSFITRNSHITEERFKELMLNNEELVSDFGTILNGEQAVKEGLVDSIGSLSDAISFLINENE